MEKIITKKLRSVLPDVFLFGIMLGASAALIYYIFVK